MPTPIPIGATCVLGASGHLGSAVVSALRAAGRPVWGTGLHRPVAADVPSLVLDLREPTAVAEVASRAPSAVVHCATPPWPCAEDAPWQVGPLFLGRLVAALAPAWAVAGGGVVVATAGLAVSHGVDVPWPFAAAHGALPALARTLTHQHGRQGVRFCVLAASDLSGGHAERLPGTAARRAALERHAGTGRRPDAEQAARLVTWLLDHPATAGSVVSLHGAL